MLVTGNLSILSWGWNFCTIKSLTTRLNYLWMTKRWVQGLLWKGYQTDGEAKINITDNTMGFVQGGQSKKFTTSMSARKSWLIRRHRGVPFPLWNDSADTGQFKYVQFMSLNQEQGLFHLFPGTSKASLKRRWGLTSNLLSDNLSGQKS